MGLSDRIFRAAREAYGFCRHRALCVAEKFAGLGSAASIPTYTSTEELRALHKLARSLPAGANVLEIGSYLGASACYLAAGLRSGGGKLFCVDTWQNETMPESPEHALHQFRSNTVRFKTRITEIRKRSDELEESDVPGELALAFLDGDHGYAAVKADFLWVASRLASEGIIAFHDSRDFPGVSRVIGEALESGKWQVVGAVGNLLWVRRARWEKCRTTAEPTDRQTVDVPAPPEAVALMT